jgi:hypothetical protein
MSDYQDLTASVPFWNNKPTDMKEGDLVEGVVRIIAEARNAKSSRTATLEKTDGERVNVWLSAVIDGAFKAGVTEGDSVRITYKGKTKTADGSAEFNDYKVEVKKAQ